MTKRNLPAVSEIQPPEPTALVPAWQQNLRSAMMEAVHTADVKEITQGIVKRAKDGDAKACQLFFDYLLGAKGFPQPQSVKLQQTNVYQAPPAEDHEKAALEAENNRLREQLRQLANRKPSVECDSLLIAALESSGPQTIEQLRAVLPSGSDITGAIDRARENGRIRVRQNRFEVIA